MPLFYCDQNFVIRAHDSPEIYRKHIQELASAETVTYVLSPWHWVDMAEDADVPRGMSVADFVDSLRPAWMYDRRNIQEEEVSSAFFQFVPLQIEPPQMIGRIGDVIFELTGVREDRDTRAFVTHLRTVEADHPLRSNLRNAFATNQKNCADFTQPSSQRRFKNT